MLDMTQTEVAMQCGLTFQQIQKYEAGLVALPVGRLVMLAQALGAPLERLLVDGQSPTRRSTPASRPRARLLHHSLCGERAPSRRYARGGNDLAFPRPTRGGFWAGR